MTASVPEGVTIHPAQLTFTPGNYTGWQSVAVTSTGMAPPATPVLIQFRTRSDDTVYNELFDEWDYTTGTSSPTAPTPPTNPPTNPPINPPVPAPTQAPASHAQLCSGDHNLINLTAQSGESFCFALNSDEAQCILAFFQRIGEEHLPRDTHARCSWNAATSRCAAAGGEEDFYCRDVTITPTSTPTIPQTDPPTNPSPINPPTHQPTTSEPATSEPTSSDPTSSEPTTPAPTSSAPTTPEPTSSDPTLVPSIEPLTEAHETFSPTAPPSRPTTPEPTLPAPTTTAPTEQPRDATPMPTPTPTSLSTSPHQIVYARTLGLTTAPRQTEGPMCIGTLNDSQTRGANLVLMPCGLSTVRWVRHADSDSVGRNVIARSDPLLCMTAADPNIGSGDFIVRGRETSLQPCNSSNPRQAFEFRAVTSCAGAESNVLPFKLRVRGHHTMLEVPGCDVASGSFARFWDGGWDDVCDACHTWARRVDPIATPTGPPTSFCEEDLILDVRAVADFAAGHLNCAQSVPRLTLAAGGGGLAEVLRLVGGDRSRPIKTYCYTGTWAAQARDALLAAGFTDVVSAGGYSRNPGRQGLLPLCDARCTSSPTPPTTPTDAPATSEPTPPPPTNAACPRNCGQPERGGGTCRANGRCTSCNTNKLRVSGRCVNSISCKGRRIQSGSMTGEGCQCLNSTCHFCMRTVGGDTCRVCRDGAYLLDGACVASCPSNLASSGVGQFKRRCAEPFTCQSGRLVVEPSVNYGCKCATEGNTAIADCQICEHRAGEYGQHCLKCTGGMFLHENRCDRANCDGLGGLVEYTPGNYGRECRAPFTCASRLDERGNACKCARSVGRNDCIVCEYGEAGAICLRCTNGRFLRDGVCVDDCGDAGSSGEGITGLECT